MYPSVPYSVLFTTRRPTLDLHTECGVLRRLNAVGLDSLPGRRGAEHRRRQPANGCSTRLLPSFTGRLQHVYNNHWGAAVAQAGLWHYTPYLQSIQALLQGHCSRLAAVLRTCSPYTAYCLSVARSSHIYQPATPSPSPSPPSDPCIPTSPSLQAVWLYGLRQQAVNRPASAALRASHRAAACQPDIVGRPCAK